MVKRTETKLAVFLDFYNSLSHDGLNQLADIYTEDVIFIDPVHKITGRQHLTEYFSHAYQRLTYCNFEPISQSDGESLSFISWIMTLSHPAIAAGKPVEVNGCTELRWRDQHIYYHRDYYDLTELVYQHVPVLGWVTTQVKQKMAKA
ncbi:nuclear transport factor 2 family protein [Arsukibacterium indicum]|uniref:Nuclear transport factor 2 family protein n=1 Tax=Arsukibacterium indicum TaxID=2848612 RepID=A0ABS6MQH8_9GAMM|nr:nuclear transport factor 2 family protein [Arsukibacterium indicum]MBV2131026.1 nuclear transport factor 2 family protein [Arsukibacterium indicum]